MGDNYIWLPVAGSWNVASNWNDKTTGLNPAAVAPGSADNVTVNAAGGGATTIITGTGNAASLTLTGGTTVLHGQFATGSLALSGANGTALTLGSGDSLAVSGGAATGNVDSVNVSGTLTVVGQYMGGYGSLNVGGGGVVTLGAFSGQQSQIVVSGGSLSIAGDANQDQGGQTSAATVTNGGQLTVGGNYIASYGAINVTSGGVFTIEGDILSDTQGTAGTPNVIAVNGGTLRILGSWNPQSGTPGGVSASNGGHIQIAAVGTLWSNFTTVDASSSLEFGATAGCRPAPSPSTPGSPPRSASA